MALPTTREQFKDRCLRALGHPVIKINVDPTQVDDCVDEALQYFQDYHFDGSERQYLSHKITDTDKANRYLLIDEKYIGVVRVFELSSMLGSSHLFSLTYQFAQSDFLASALTGSMVPYWMAMTHIELVQQVLMGRQPIRFNRHADKMYIDMDWNRVNTGDHVVIECFEKMDPETYPDVWTDRWLYRYCTQLIKRDWGNNLKKFGNMPMAGGVVFNGQQIYDEAVAELTKMEEEVINNFSIPCIDLMG